MAFSLNLPYAICKPASIIARRLRPVSTEAMGRATDLRAYYRWQYDTTRKFLDRFWSDLDFTGKTVLDFGSGLGGRAPFLIAQGASEVICLDINAGELELGRQYTAEMFPDTAHRIHFLEPHQLDSRHRADIALLVDCFEHFSTPEQTLSQVISLLRPGGMAWIGSIGWLHHAASHCNCYIPIPWCQAIFSERAIIRAIQDFQHAPDFVPTQWDEIEGVDRWDRITSLKDRPGEPLNLLNLRQIRALLTRSEFELLEFKTWPISGGRGPLAPVLRPLARLPLTREFFHSYYTAVLKKPAAAPALAVAAHGSVVNEMTAASAANL
jgi:SAM-dependent methyltransferase